MELLSLYSGMILSIAVALTVRTATLALCTLYCSIVSVPLQLPLYTTTAATATTASVHVRMCLRVCKCMSCLYELCSCSSYARPLRGHA